MSDLIDLSDLKILFPDKASSLTFLENIRWGKKPICPHCGSERITSFKKEHRHHCNACNVSFSATVNTIFHNTRIPLNKWFAALALLFKSDQKVSARKLASEINVNKNTAWQMLSKLNDSVEKAHKQLPKERKYDAFFKDMGKTVSVPLEGFKVVIRRLLATQEKM
jgi:transposase-like protein